jgi:hypothetical protein
VANLETERGQLLSEMEGMSISMKAMRLAQEKVCRCSLRLRRDYHLKASLTCSCVGGVCGTA